jgi:hypothetical protein
MSTGRLGAGDTAIQPTILDAKGDLIVATAADTPARLAVGSANQVLTVDSSTATGLKWATPSSGDLVKINKTTIGSGVSTVSLDNVFTTTYSNYRVIIEWESCSATAPTMNFRLRVGGTDNSGATAYQPKGYSVTSGTLAAFGSAASSFALGKVVSTDQSFTLFEIIAPASARATNFTINHFYSNNNEIWSYAATHNLATAYDGFTVYPSSGTLTGGKITVYGYKD